ncbi:MAG: DNA primase [Proteobacteria bacterium]|nr:MAG: DNA primase [Pseudomonadota bacterium]
MSVSPAYLDDLRQRLPLSGVVARKVRLVRRGREFTGLCPFHHEKTPSFTVSDDKGFYHCFGCGAHGDVIRFVMESDNLPFREAVERLAREAGMPPPEIDLEAEAKAKERLGLLEAEEAAAAWFESQLWSASGREALAYLRRRGLADETIRGFRLGYAPAARTLLKDAMLARGFSEDVLVRSGLVILPEDGGPTFDRFRHRVMFPIRDGRGRVIAFGGRALDDAPAKYLNSPESELFHKGHTLYNLDQARGPARERGGVLVVEGYMDVISLAQAGFREAVAPLGTALTEEQLTLLWRTVPEPTLCFDGDAAGRRAAARAMERALPGLAPGHSLRFLLLPQGEDPDSLVQAQGAAAFAALQAGSKSLADMLWSTLLEAYPTDTPERRAAFDEAIKKTVARIADHRVRSHYESDMAARRRRLFAPLPADRPGREPGRGRGSGTLRRGQTDIRRPGRLSAALMGQDDRAGRSRRREQLILACVLNHPLLIERHEEELAGLELQNPDLDKLRSEIIRIAASDHDLDMAALRRHLMESGFGKAIDGLDTASAPLWFAQPDAALIDVEQGWRHVVALHRRLSTLEREIKRLEDELARDFSDEALGRLRALKVQLDQAEGREVMVAGYGVASGREPTV